MANKDKNKAAASYVKTGIIAAAVLAAAGGGFLAVKGLGGNAGMEQAISDVSENAAFAADVRIAVLRMDAIQQKAKVLANLRKQREKYENELKSSVEKNQKALENEKNNIEKSQDLFAREVLQKRVMDYQRKVADFQRTVTEKAQAIEAAYQKALVGIQEKHLDGLVNAIIAKKKLSLVLDGRFVRMGADSAESLDITEEVVSSLNKRIGHYEMEKPKGF
ncbi:MAG: OmpH family outer membrane protein [Rickettsiales bacterium]|nr:OmpH family outer membrane protein [Rickettsiales bacterium]